jgi:hypothetical protein
LRERLAPSTTAADEPPSLLKLTGGAGAAAFTLGVLPRAAAQTSAPPAAG